MSEDSNPTPLTTNPVQSPAARLFERVRRAVAETPFAGRTYAFGGWARDTVLGRAPRDIDLIVLGPRGGTRLAVTLSRMLGGSPVIVFTRSRAAQFEVDGVSVECRTLWRPGQTDSSALVDEVMAMDVTANALLLDLADGTLLDPAGIALEDIKRRVIRTPRRPEDSFGADPRRLMRAVRLTAELGFALDPAAAAYITAHAEDIRLTSIERIRDELLKLVAGADPVRGIRLMDELGLLAVLLPEVAALKGADPDAGKDAFERTLDRVGAVRPDPQLRLAALLLGIGGTGAQPAGTVPARGQDRAAGEAAARRLRTLCTPIALRHDVARLVHNHPLFCEDPTPKQMRLALRRLGSAELVRKLAELRAVDLALRDSGRADNLVAAVDRLLPETIAAAGRSLPVSGEDVMEAFNLAPGPEVGRLIDIAAKAHARRPGMDRSALLRMLRSKVRKPRKKP
ncbi:MAG: hypothetical protein R6X13_03965 [bacterium]